MVFVNNYFTSRHFIEAYDVVAFVVSPLFRFFHGFETPVDDYAVAILDSVLHDLVVVPKAVTEFVKALLY